MVINAATFGRSGVHDYLLVRATAAVLFLYILYLLGFIACHDMTYATWTAFFNGITTKAFTLLALVSMLVHAWIGIWQVLSDYVKNTMLRLICQWVLNVIAVFYVAVGIVILWGV